MSPLEPETKQKELLKRQCWGRYPHRMGRVKMANRQQCFPSQDHWETCSKYRVICTSPEESDPVGPGFCFVVIMSNQITNYSTGHYFSGETSKKQILTDMPQLVGSTNILDCVLLAFACSIHTHMSCALAIFYSHSLSDENHHNKGKMQSS